MRSVQSRRRPQAVSKVGLGLLEIVSQRGSQADPLWLLPGQRDATGFWFPCGYSRPGEVLTDGPEQPAPRNGGRPRTLRLVDSRRSSD